MKKILLTLTLSLSSYFTFGQNDCSNYLTPEIISNESYLYSDSVGINIVSSLAAGFAHTGAGSNSQREEYFFTFNNQFVGSTETPENLKIIGSTVDGLFIPSQLNRYNSTVVLGSELNAYVVGYNLNNIKALIDSILTGTSGNAACFQIIDLVEPGFYTRLNNLGIMNGSNVNNFNDIMTIVDAYANDNEPLSIAKILDFATEMNNIASFLQNGCGGSHLPICIKVNPEVAHHYIVTNKTVNENVSVNQMLVTNFDIYPNPANMNGFTVHFGSSNSKNLTITCTNSLGQTVRTLKIDSSLEGNNVMVDTKDMEKGIYFVNVSNGTSSSTKKITIL